MTTKGTTVKHTLTLSIVLLTLFPVYVGGAEPMKDTVIPADRDASASTRLVLDYIVALTRRTDKKLMSGQFLGWYPDVNLAAAEKIHEQSGKWPAIIGVDYYETKLDVAKRTEPELHKPPRWRNINRLIKDYWAKGGLSTVSVHMTNPATGGKAWDITKKPTPDWLDPSTEIGKAYLGQIDQIADGLEDLQKSGVVVLYRPFHEWDWAFWWRKLEPDLARKMWQHMFRHLVVNRKLHNIIWVYNGSMNRYPGNEFVDLNSYDYYTKDPAVAAAKYKEMRGTGKPFALGEFGPPGAYDDSITPRNYDYAPFAKKVLNVAPDTVYFLAWRDAWGLHRNPGTRELMNDPLVLNRDDLASELFSKLQPKPTTSAASSLSNPASP